MSYRLSTEEAVGDNLRHVAEEQIDRIILQVVGPTHLQPDEIVHDVRKRLKRLRALVRLMRYELGKTRYHQANECLRDIGRKLSDTRDAQVYVETLDHIKEHFGEAIAPDAFAEVQQVLNLQYQQASARLNQHSEVFHEVATTLNQFRHMLGDWSLSSLDWRELRRGLEQTYRWGREAQKRAIHHPQPEHWHEWRKRVKDLWHQLQILEPIWPSLMKEMAGEAKALADDLGNDHDLAVLRQFLTTQAETLENTNEVTALLALVEIRQAQLRGSAQGLGQRLYAEKPKIFSDRLGTYWRTWQTEIHQPPIVGVACEDRAEPALSSGVAI